jgi:hypothetical protein
VSELYTTDNQSISVRQGLPLQLTWFIGREMVKSLSRLKYKYDNINTAFRWMLKIKLCKKEIISIFTTGNFP